MAKGMSKAGLERYRQRLYERCDGLDEACMNLRWAAEALEGICHEDERGLLEDLRERLGRERQDARRLLERIEQGGPAALEREMNRLTY